MGPTKLLVGFMSFGVSSIVDHSSCDHSQVRLKSMRERPAPSSFFRNGASYFRPMEVTRFLKKSYTRGGSCSRLLGGGLRLKDQRR